MNDRIAIQELQIPTIYHQSFKRFYFHYISILMVKRNKEKEAGNWSLATPLVISFSKLNKSQIKLVLA